MSFLSSPPPQGPGRARLGNALSVSLAVHGLGFLLILAVLTRMPADVLTTSPDTSALSGVVWVAAPGPGGGGGGGGERRPEPARTAQAPGRDRVTVRAAATPAAAPTPEIAPLPAPAVDVPVVTTAAGLESLPGEVSPIPVLGDSRGPGTGAGAGGGDGAGSGPGKGSGLGPGEGGNTGGGVYEPGNGISMPRLIYETKPVYPGEAMRARLQGLVFLEGVVLPDGTLDRIQITRSLDQMFGLDQEAIRTVKQWRFAPGRDRDGRPVPVRVGIEMAFTLR